MSSEPGKPKAANPEPSAAESTQETAENIAVEDTVRKKKEGSEELTKRLQKLALERQKVSVRKWNGAYVDAFQLLFPSYIVLSNCRRKMVLTGYVLFKQTHLLTYLLRALSKNLTCPNIY